MEKEASPYLREADRISSIGNDVSKEIQVRLAVLLEEGTGPHESFIEIIGAVATLLRANRLEEVTFSYPERRRLARFMSMLFGETHAGKGRRARRLYYSYFTDEEWERFWNWVNRTNLQ